MDYETAYDLARRITALPAWVATPCQVAEARDNWRGAWCVTVVYASDPRTCVIRAADEWDALWRLFQAAQEANEQ